VAKSLTRPLLGSLLGGFSDYMPFLKGGFIILLGFLKHQKESAKKEFFL
jgi:hypothetical protein